MTLADLTTTLAGGFPPTVTSRLPPCPRLSKLRPLSVTTVSPATDPKSGWMPNTRGAEVACGSLPARKPNTAR